jgi:rhodanese-related sulfurtransferase
MKHSTPHFGLILALILALAVTVSACGASANPAPAPAADAAGQAAALALPDTVDAKITNDVRNRDDVVILDVREDDEFKSGHIPGAEWIPLGQLATRMNELPKDKTIVAVCRSGNRSGQATELLRQNGFNVHNMQGGMNSWVQAGYAVER